MALHLGQSVADRGVVRERLGQVEELVEIGGLAVPGPIGSG